MTEEFTKCEATGSSSKMGFRFLASPKRVLIDGNNRVRALEMEENKLNQRDDTAAVGLKQLYEFPSIASCLRWVIGWMRRSGFPIRTACTSPIPQDWKRS